MRNIPMRPQGSPPPPAPASTPACCRGCGCGPEQHADLSDWLDEVKANIRRFRNPPTTTKRLPPATGCLRLGALRWSQEEAALSVLTAGRFSPRRCRPEPGLISVCVPTSAKRHVFHPLLYDNFRRQAYEPKELVVVDTGQVPSSFLLDVARQDKRVIYRHFPVQDAKHDRRQAVLQMMQPKSFNRSRSFTTELYEPPPDSWSLGLKRNIAASLAAGEVIAHFDDDDLYTARYLGFMLGELCKAAAGGGDPPVPVAELDRHAAIITLQDWHLFDFAGLSFRYMDPQTDPGVLNSWRKDMIYGYGFSYMYTRKAWRTQAFPDTEDCEDDVFMAGLRDKHKACIGLVKLPSQDFGLVAHTFHTDNTGVSEFNGSKRLGSAVPVPPGFEDLLPILRGISTQIPRPLPPRPLVPPGPLSWPRTLQPTSGPGTGKGKGKGKGKGFPGATKLANRVGYIAESPWESKSFAHFPPQTAYRRTS